MAWHGMGGEQARVTWEACQWNEKERERETEGFDHWQ